VNAAATRIGYNFSELLMEPAGGFEPSTY